MNTAQDHAKAAWRSGGSVPAIEAGILAYNQELQGRLLKEEERADTLSVLLNSTREYALDTKRRLDRKDALLAQGAAKIEELQSQIESYKRNTKVLIQSINQAMRDHEN